MAISNKRARDVQRVAHLIGAVLLGAYFYSPLGDEAAYTAAIQWGVFPGLTVSGTLLWQWPRLRRVLRRDGGRDAGDAGAPLGAG